MKKQSSFHYLFVIYSLACSLIISSCKTNYYTKQGFQAHMMSINAEIDQDSLIVRYIAPYKQQLEAKMNEVIGQSDQALPRTPREGQSLGGIFFAESLLNMGRAIDPEVVCAIGTKDGIRSDIPKGNILVGTIYEWMPFENYLTILELSGKDMIVLGQFIAKTNGQPVAGMQITIKNGELIDFLIQGKQVKEENSYKIATYDYLANGGDRIEGFSNPLQRQNTPVLLREGLIAYIQKLTKDGEKINAVSDERIHIIQ